MPARPMFAVWRAAGRRSVRRSTEVRERAHRGWAIWLYAVVVPVYLGYTWWTDAIAVRGVGAVAPYALLVPVVAGLFALVWLDERLSTVKTMGAALTLAGLAVSRGWLRPPRRHQPPDPPSPPRVS